MSKEKVGVLMLRVPVQVLTGECDAKFLEMGEHVIAQARVAASENNISLVIVPASSDAHGNHLYDIKEY